MENCVEVNCESILANANTVFKAIAHEPSSLLTAYACSNMVLMADTLHTKRVLFSLRGHESRVNSVAWLKSDTLVSVSDRIVVYVGQGSDGANWKIVQSIKLPE
jgi:hypothetical protein